MPDSPRDSAPKESVKGFYSHHHDKITSKRHQSPYWLRRYAHHRIHHQFLRYLRPGDRILDAGCGDGVLSRLLASHGHDVVGVDISAPNTRSARALARQDDLPSLFVQADLEHLPFPDEHFNVVVSSHVVEHLPDPIRGLEEIRRVTRHRALIAMPTCLNPACWTLLGGDNYWRPGRRFLIATPIGFVRSLVALVKGMEGPDEGYQGADNLPHVWRFPWSLRSLVERAGFEIQSIEAGPLIVPYVLHLLPFLRWIQPLVDRLARWPLLRHLGYGTLLVCTARRGTCRR